MGETIEETRGQWYYRQLLGSADLTGGRLFHILTGNLGHQIAAPPLPDLPSHRYAEIGVEVREIATVDGRRIVIDATFRGAAWDGRSPMPYSCSPGRDYAGGADPDGEKQKLKDENCDPAIREPFIVALARSSGAGLRMV